MRACRKLVKLSVVVELGVAVVLVCFMTAPNCAEHCTKAIPHRESRIKNCASLELPGVFISFLLGPAHRATVH